MKLNWPTLEDDAGGGFARLDCGVCFIEYIDDMRTFAHWTRSEGFQVKKPKATTWTLAEKRKLVAGLKELHRKEDAAHTQDKWYYLSAYVMRGTKTPADCHRQINRILQKHKDYDVALLYLASA